MKILSGPVIFLLVLTIAVCAQQESQQPCKLFPVWQSGTSGYIDATGKVIVEPQFASGYEFSDGLAAVESGGMWGYINREGVLIWKPSK